MLEVSLPQTMRWIPKGMNVMYLKIARTDLTAVCEISTEGLERPQELPLTVHVTDTAGEEVFRAEIAMHITPKKG
jgi:hypothetical protein